MEPRTACPDIPYVVLSESSFPVNHYNRADECKVSMTHKATMPQRQEKNLNSPLKYPVFDKKEQKFEKNQKIYKGF